MSLSYFGYGTKSKVYTVEVNRAREGRLPVVYKEQKVESQNPAFQGYQLLLQSTAVRVSTELTRQELSDYLTVPKAYIVESADRDKSFPLISVARSLVQKVDSVESPLRVKQIKKEKSTPKSAAKTTPKTKQTSVVKQTKEQATSPIKQLKNTMSALNQKLFVPLSSSESDDDDVNHLLPVQTTDVTLKFDGKATVPSWKKSGDTEADSFSLEQFFVDLKRCKDLQLYKTDDKMIFMALNNSGLSHVLDEIPVDAGKDLDKFIAAMRDAYGATPMMLREVVRNLKQKSDESYHSFFYRIINAYYRSRGTEPKSLAEIVQVASEKQDIQFIFLSGLLDQTVAYEIRANATELEFSKLPVKARAVRMAKLAQKMPIQQVDSTAQVNEDLRLIVQALNLRDRQHRGRQGGFQRNNRFQNNGSGGRQAYGGGFRGNQTRSFHSSSRRGRGAFNSGGRQGGFQSGYDRQNGSNSQQYGQNRNSGQRGQRGNYQGRQDRQCYECGRYGHYAKECPQVARQCFECGKVGHLAKDCPQRR